MKKYTMVEVGILCKEKSYKNLKFRNTMKFRDFFLKKKKPIIIIAGIILLNIIFGFDARFTIINLLWLLI